MAAMQQAVMQQAMENALAATATALEDQLDSEMHRLDNLDEADIEKLRKKRVQDMKAMQEKKKKWLAKGHGEVSELLTEKQFFSDTKGEDRLVCHFYRENWPCKVMDKHLNIIAKKHIETKFVRINAEKAPYLCEKLSIWMLPTLALVKKEKVVDYVVGFSDFGDTDDFKTEVLAARLGAAETIHFDDATDYGGGGLAPKTVARGGNRNIRRGGGPVGSSEEDSDFDDL